MVKRVLIVDDNDTNLFVLGTILKGYGFEVTVAENGKEALDKARLNPPDLIVTDILMPVMDGYTLCREWKSDDILKHIPLVFYTATYTDAKDEEFALNLGVDRFIIKPQEPDKLMNMLQEVLDENYAIKDVSNKPLGDEMEFFRRHNEVLFKKLEKKMSDLEIANQKLMISEERYHLSFENVMDVIYTIDTNLNILSLTPSVERILGYKSQDFIGRPVTDLGNILTSESFEQAVTDISLVLNGDTIPATMYRFIAKDGTIKYGEVSGSPIIRDGTIVGMISVARDITDRKRMEEKLRENEKKYRELFDFLPIPVYEMDFEGTMTAANRAVYETFGGTEADLKKGVSVWKLSSPEDIAKSKKNIERLLRGEHIEGTEYTLTRLNGTVFPAIAISRLTYSDGKPVGIRGAIVDVTELKQAEEALRKSETKYRGILENMDEAYYELDLEGNLVFFNEAMISETGYSREELMGMNYRRYVSPETQKQVSMVFSTIYKTGQPNRLFEYDVIMKGGQTKNYESWANILLDNNNQIIGFRGMARDISARKKAEEGLRETLAHLRKAVGTTIQIMVSAVEIRDPYTAGHQLRSADLARAIATEMGLPKEKIESIRMAASIHDIGKLSIPAEILSKPATLTTLEISLIKEHPLRGYEMLRDVDSPWPLAQIVYQHHERMNGTGYPRNLKGDEILVEARIMAVADVVEAMASHRPYRPTLGIDAALDEIVRNRYTLYDPEVVDACLRLFHDKGYTLER